MMHAMPSRRTDNLITQQAGGELLIYDEKIHKACCLNDIAAAVWSACDGSQTAATIATAVTTALQRPVSEDLVLFTLEELRRDGLLLPDAVPETRPLPTRRELMRKIGFGAAMALPVVTAIMAPKAAQAYSGCFDCQNATPAKKRQTTSPEYSPPPPSLPDGLWP